jgi:hypothetical protein
MHRSIALPGPVYIESGGILVSRGEAQRIDPTMHDRIDAWPGPQPTDDPGELQALDYSGGTLHSKETVDLCRRLLWRGLQTTPQQGPASKVALVYAHRGHRCQWKTPLLQSLLAKLGPRLQAHGLRVDHAHLPFDLILFAVATLSDCDRCIVLKDNAIRLGTTDVVPVNTVQYLVLSKSIGLWTVEGIVITDDVLAFPSRMAPSSLNTLWTDPHRHTDSLSLASPMTNAGVGILHLVRVRQSDALVKSALSPSTLVGLPVPSAPERAQASAAYGDWLAPTCEREGIGDA